MTWVLRGHNLELSDTGPITLGGLSRSPPPGRSIAEGGGGRWQAHCGDDG